VKRLVYFCAISLFGCFLFQSGPASAQSKQVKIACVAFYNLENLFDTINDPNINDEEFLPSGTSRWDTQRYREKLSHMAEAISQIGDDYVKGGPVILGVSEVENRQVMADLIHTPPLDKAGYDIVHYDSPDKRGIDVGLIYQPKVFKVTSSRAVPLRIASKPDWTTRDILVVAGVFDGDPMYILVNHWPSRSSGQKESQPLRNAAADLCRVTKDSIMKEHPGAKIIIMGDLNDDPVDESLIKHLKIQTKKQDAKPGDIYDPMWQMYRDGIGSLAYNDNWNLFDQIIVSYELLDKNNKGYQFFKAEIFNRKFLIQKEGAYAGYPFRTFAGGVYLGGYSDHLPACIFLVKEVK
jgi:hypothetical protein